MLDIDLLMSALRRPALGGAQGFLGLLGKTIDVHVR